MTSQTVTTRTAKTLRARAAKVGVNHGYCGQLVARNGRVMWEGDVFAAREAALSQALDAAAKL